MQTSRLIGLVAFGVLLAGCYTLQPTGGVVPGAGTSIALDINDAGRVALGGSMGPEIARIEGRLLSVDNDEFRVAVSAVHLLRGGEQAWSGEDVRVRREYVSTIQERRFSRGRTIALGAAGVGGVAFFVTRSIVAGGNESTTKPPPDTAASQRIPQPQP